MFAAIGLDHGHIHGQTDALIAAGGTLAGYATGLDELAEAFEAKHRGAIRKSEAALLDDPEITLVTSAAIPSERVGLAVRCMRAGKDVLLDKPGVLTRTALDTLRTTQAETGRRVRVVYSELESNAAAQTTLRLVHEGTIGRMLHYNGTGPHRLDQGVPRPDWFFDRSRNGGILVDIASHQITSFLAYTGRTRGRVVAARVVCRGDRPDFQDMGDVMLETEGADGYARVDWYTPAGLPTWGDGRIVLTGTEGVIEMRKYVDPAGPDGSAVAPHLIMTDGAGPRRIACDDVSPFYARCLADSVEGTVTAMDRRQRFTSWSLRSTRKRLRGPGHEHLSRRDHRTRRRPRPY